MSPKQPRRRILPKISTLPRQPTEAASYLDLYKLAIEKKRLLQELASITQRQQDIHERLATVEQQINQLKATAEALEPTLPTATAVAPIAEDSGYNTVFLDY